VQPVSLAVVKYAVYVNIRHFYADYYKATLSDIMDCNNSLCHILTCNIAACRMSRKLVEIVFLASVMGLHF